MRRIAVTVLALVAGYVALAAVLTWPLAARITTHLPRQTALASADTFLAVWALAWQTHALGVEPARIAHANIYWPASFALFYSTPGFALLPMFAPPFAATGDPILAFNAMLLLSLGLTAAVLHLVTARWTGSAAAGIVAAATYLGSRWVVVQAGSTPQYTALAAMPLLIALLARGATRGRWLLVLILLLVYQGTADALYVTLPLFLTVGLAVAGMLLRAASRTRGLHALLGLTLAGCALSPIYAGYWTVVRANPALRQQSVWANAPGQWLPFAMSSVVPVNGPLALDGLVWGLVLLGIAAGAARAARGAPRRARMQAALWLAVAYTISWLVPRFVPGGRELVVTIARDPLRLGFGGLVAACLLAGAGFAACADAVARRIPARWGTATWTVLLLAVLAWRVDRLRWWPGEYPLVEAPAPGSERTALREQTGAVLVLPLGKPELRALNHSAAMVRSIDHWRPLLNGYSSYYPQGFPERMALAERLPDRTALDQLRRETNLRTIVVLGGGMPNIAYGAWHRAIERGALPGVRIRHEAPDALVLDVDEPDRLE